MDDLRHYRYLGARAMVLLHERYLRAFVDTWRRAKRAGVTLPETDNSSYASMEELLRHLLRAARMYMTWMCEKLELPDPGIRPAPEQNAVEAEVDGYLTHLLERWRTPLADVPEERFFRPIYEARWKTHYCIDAMLEHAVMHPIRHTFQLEELMQGSG